MIITFTPNPARFPIYSLACEHLQRDCYEPDAIGNSKFWKANVPEVQVFNLDGLWHCEYCARRLGVLW